MVKMKFKNLTYFALFSLTLLNPAEGLVKDAVNENEPVLYYADSQTYDRDLGILILKGNVEFDHQGNILEADYVTYNENTDIVTASGNVRMRQADGDINFAEYVELTGDLKEGIVLQIRTLMQDDSKMAAIEGRKFENSQELDQAVYTPCMLCGDRPPTWQINARKAIKDDINKDIQFTDADFRILDVPLFYMPYATQPLERRSGFLLPQPVFMTDFGPGIQIPYYFAISKSDDLTVVPYFFTEQNPLLMADYRRSFGSGTLEIEGSLTDYKKSIRDKNAEKNNRYKLPDTRGHIYGDGKINFTNIWRGELSGGYVSDKTYFRKYSISGWKNSAVLTSEGKLEGFLNQRDYVSAKTYYFQGLRTEDKQDRIPVVLPIIDYTAFSATDPLGGRFSFNGNLLNLTREIGINMQRGIGEVGWKRPWIAPFGQVFTIFGSARGDLYKIENKDSRLLNRSIRTLNAERKGGARFFPQAGLDWRWPFVKSWNKQSFVVQPTVQLIGAPTKDIGVQQRRIPDDDSSDFEFNDINLFSVDRFPGYDRIDLGSRAVYGGEVLMTGDLFGDVDVFLGQSYSFADPENVDPFKGLSRKASDYVGRIEANPFSWANINYRFRLDEKTYDHRFSEVGGSIGPAIAKLSGSYTFINRDLATTNRQDLNQLVLVFSSNFTKNWTITAGFRQDLNSKQQGGGPLQRGIGLLYKDDCFGLGVTFQRQYYRARDVRPGNIFLFTLILKNIGTYSTSFNLETGPLGNYTTQQRNRLTPGG